MKTVFPLLCLFCAGMAGAVETEPARYPGVAELRVGTDAVAIRPGQAFTVGLLFRHEPKFHTYWKAPGIVGVGATVEWKLPKGFEVGEIQWPAPRKTKMATWTAYGYESDTCLVIPMRAPKEFTPEMLDGDGNLVMKGEVGWMACATTCHPGWHKFELKIPLAKKQEAIPEIDRKWRDLFEKSRARFPKAPPEGWAFTVKAPDEETIVLTARAPEAAELDWSDVYFYSHDNQVSSHEQQKVAVLEDGKGFRITLTRPEFGPENPGKLSGVLFRPGGWPGLDHPWMIISAPW